MRIPRTRQIRTAPPLLASFAAYTVGMVAMVVWVARDDSPWVLVLAVAVLLGLVTMLLRTLRHLLGGGESPLPDARPIRRRTFLLAGLPAVIVPLLAVTMVQASRTPQATPTATVRDFLSAAVVDNDGETACAYLTARGRLALEGAARGRTTCQSFFGGASLELGGLVVSSDTQLRALHYSTRRAGAEQIVTVSHDGQEMRLVLRRGNEVELNEFEQLPTPWRIDSSVIRLGEPADSGGV